MRDCDTFEQPVTRTFKLHISLLLLSLLDFFHPSFRVRSQSVQRQHSHLIYDYYIKSSPMTHLVLTLLICYNLFLLFNWMTALNSYSADL